MSEHHHHGPRPDAESLARADGAFHDGLAADYADRVQWHTIRNQKAHQLIHDAALSFGSGTWAEIGAGLSLDGEQLAKKGIPLIAVDPSANMLRQASARLVGQKIPWKAVQAQGAALPFEDNALGGVMWVASLHHLPDTLEALKESARVVKPGGGVIVGMEPASWWHEPVERLMDRLRPKLAKGGRFQEHGSPADEMGEGFNRKELEDLGRDAGLEVVQLIPVWFSLGYLHLGLEGLYRVAKLRQRLQIPRFLESGLWAMDSALSKMPGINRLFWHWVAVYKKPDPK